MDDQYFREQALKSEKLKKIIDTFGEDIIVQDDLTNCSKEEFIEERKRLHSSQKSIINKRGTKIPFKMNRTCTACNKYSFKTSDDLYQIKFETCEQCYILLIEGREENWKSGQRPWDNFDSIEEWRNEYFKGI